MRLELTTFSLGGWGEGRETGAAPGVPYHGVRGICAGNPICEKMFCSGSWGEPNRGVRVCDSALPLLGGALAASDEGHDRELCCSVADEVLAVAPWGPNEPPATLSLACP